VRVSQPHPCRDRRQQGVARDQGDLRGPVRPRRAAADGQDHHHDQEQPQGAAQALGLLVELHEDRPDGVAAAGDGRDHQAHPKGRSWRWPRAAVVAHASSLTSRCARRIKIAQRGVSLNRTTPRSFTETSVEATDDPRGSGESCPMAGDTDLISEKSTHTGDLR
jgi:hypothetical protein